MQLHIHFLVALFSLRKLGEGRKWRLIFSQDTFTLFSLYSDIPFARGFPSELGVKRSKYIKIWSILYYHYLPIGHDEQFKKPHKKVLSQKCHAFYESGVHVNVLAHSHFHLKIRFFWLEISYVFTLLTRESADIQHYFISYYFNLPNILSLMCDFTVMDFFLTLVVPAVVATFVIYLESVVFIDIHTYIHTYGQQDI